MLSTKEDGFEKEEQSSQFPRSDTMTMLEGKKLPVGSRPWGKTSPG